MCFESMQSNSTRRKTSLSCQEIVAWHSRTNSPVRSRATGNNHALTVPIQCKLMARLSYHWPVTVDFLLHLEYLYSFPGQARNVPAHNLEADRIYLDYRSISTLSPKSALWVSP